MAVRQTGKADNAALTQLKRDVKAKQPAKLYFFYGEETWLRDSYLGQLKDLILPKGLEEFNLHTLNGKACTPNTLADAVDSLPMMSSRSLILIWDCDIFKAPQRDQDAYAELLGDLPDYVCVIFIYDTIKLDKRSLKGALGKLAKGSPALVQFSRQENRDLIPWIQKHMKALGKTIDRTQAEYLIFVTGGRMADLKNGIDKTAAYAKGSAVTQADIDAVCDPVLDAVVFQMTDCIAQGDFPRAAGILADLLAMEQPPMMILGMMGKQVRQLYTARLALEQKLGREWLMEIWSMKSAWAANRLLDNAGRFPAGWYRKAVLLTAEADRTLKLSYNEEKAILSELLARLAEAAKQC